MSPFKPFYNDWIDISPLFVKESHLRFYDYLPVNLDIEFFSNLKFTKEAYKQYRIEAAVESNKILGNKPALCLSGGVDSQYMLQCYIDAKLDFDTYILVFNDDLNKHDVEHAIEYCKEIGISYKEIPINIVNFLNRENYDYGMLYESASPHFNTHYKLFNILRDMGHTGVCCGGNTPIKNIEKNTWGNNFTRNVLNFVNYVKVSGFMCIGDFIAFHPKLAWSLAFLMEEQKITGMHTMHNTNEAYSNQFSRYAQKVNGYILSGVYIKPQQEKYTGFELVKKYYEEKTNDPWTFEKLFRHPLEKILTPSTSTPVFKFEEGVQQYVDELHKKCLENLNIGNIGSGL